MNVDAMERLCGVGDVLVLGCGHFTASYDGNGIGFVFSLVVDRMGSILICGRVDLMASYSNASDI